MLSTKSYSCALRIKDSRRLLEKKLNDIWYIDLAGLLTRTGFILLNYLSDKCKHLEFCYKDQSQICFFYKYPVLLWSIPITSPDIY